MDVRIQGFPPVWREDAKILILGSMPSAESLRAAFYYAHPRNAFWPMLAEILGARVPTDIEEKRALLIGARIALWDATASCVRSGSLDSAIRDAVANDVPALIAKCPDLRAVLFNGATAENLYRRAFGAPPDGIEGTRMPSTSPAYTLPYEKKCAAWRREIGRWMK